MRDFDRMDHAVGQVLVEMSRPGIIPDQRELWDVEPKGVLPGTNIPLIRFWRYHGSHRDAEEPRKIIIPDQHVAPYLVPPGEKTGQGPSVTTRAAPVRSGLQQRSDAKVSFDGEFDTQNVLVALFGNYDPSRKSSSVTMKGSSGDESGTLIPILDSAFIQGGAQKHLYMTSTDTQSDGHCCGPRIGVYVFAKRGPRWVSEVADQEAFRFGAFSSSGKARMIKFGPDLYGFSLSLDDMHQGIEATVEQFVADG